MASAEHRPILLITRSWHGTGGMQRLSRDLARELGQVYGSRFSLIHPSKPGVLSLAFFVCRTMRAAVRLRGQRPFIHLGDTSLIAVGSWMKRIAGGKLSLTACGLDVIWPPRWYQWMIRRYVPFADRIVCISDATRDEVIKRGVSEKKTMIIPCGIQPVAISSDVRDQHLLITVGRLVPRKGVAWFVEYVLPQLAAEDSELRYVIVGDGPDASRIQKIIHDKHLENVVQMKTSATDEERDALLRRAGMFVMPVIPHMGDIEGFGIVCIEATVRGTPVAAARIGGVQDAVIEGETGSFFKPGDVDDCARCIRNLIRQPLSGEKVSSATVTRYGWPALIEQYQHVFH